MMMTTTFSVDFDVLRMLVNFHLDCYPLPPNASGMGEVVALPSLDYPCSKQAKLHYLKVPADREEKQAFASTGLRGGPPRRRRHFPRSIR
jgi:hypothetical protein